MDTVDDLLKVIPNQGDIVRLRFGGSVIEVENRGTLSIPGTCPKCLHDLDDGPHGAGRVQRRVCLAMVGGTVCTCGEAD